VESSKSGGLHRGAPLDGIVKIISPEGQTAGTGFILSADGQIATCAHVLADCGYGPGDSVEIERLTGDRRIRDEARIGDAWADPDAEDVAFLVLSREASDVRALQLGSSQGATIGRRYETFGFPRVKRNEGMPGVIEVTGRTTEGGTAVIQGRSDEVSTGFSGAPVWDSSTGLVIGMVVSVIRQGADPAGKQGTVCYLRPIEVMRRVNPSLTLPDTCPYRGLEVFEEKHKDLYFGRDRAISSLLDRLAINNLIVLVGVSGAGKSSLLRAGLAKGLAGGEYLTLASCSRVLLRPGPQPLLNLVEAFKLGADAAQLSPSDLVERIRNASSRAGVLLLVDQTERLFIDCRATKVQEQFLDTLLALADDDIRVVVSLRADFFGALLQHGPMAQAADRSHMMLLPMEDEELREAIVVPAERLGRTFETQLPEQLIADVKGRAGDLPLLEFALTELWRRDADDGVLTKSSYDRLGGGAGRRLTGVRAAVAVRAEEIWLGLNEDERQAAMRVFVNLVSIGAHPDGTGIEMAVSRRASPSEWDELARTVAERLVEARLLTATQDPLTRERIIEVAHEALLRGWDRLRSRISKYGEYVHWYDRDLAPFLRRWHQADEPEDLLLPSVMLSQAEYWLNEVPDMLAGPPQAYIQRSLDYWARQQRRLQEEKERLEAALAEAERQRQAALARWLAAEAIAVLEADATLLPRSVLLAVESLRRTSTLEGDRALRAALARLPKPIARYSCHHGAVSVAVSGDGQHFAAVDGYGGLHIWDLSRDIHWIAEKVPGKVLFVALDRSGARLGIVTDSHIIAMDLDKGEQHSHMHGMEIRAVALSADGRRLATAGPENAATVWDWTLLNTVARVNHGKTVAGVALNEDGSFLATANWDGTAALWDVSSKKQLLLVGKSSDSEKDTSSEDSTEDSTEKALNSVALDARGTLLITGGFDHSARCIKIEDGTPVFELLHGFLGQVNTVDITGDGGRFATASDDGTAAVIDLARGRELSRACPSGHVKDAALSQDGTILVTGHEESRLYDDGALALWGEASIWETAPYECDATKLLAPPGIVAFAPDESVLVGGGDGSVFRLRSNRWQKMLGTSNARVLAVAAGDDGLVVVDNKSTSYVLAWDERHIVSSRRWRDVEVHPAAISQDASRIAYGIRTSTGPTVYDARFEIEVRDLHSGQQGAFFEVGPPFALALNEDGRYLALADARHARVWDLTRVESIAEYEANHVYSVALSADGFRVAFTSTDTVMIRDLNDTMPGQALSHDGQWLSCVAITPDGRVAVAGSQEGLVTAWNVDKGRQLCRLQHDGQVLDVAISHDGAHVASVTGDGTVRVWSLDPAVLIEQARLRLTRNLTQLEWKRYFLDEPYRETCPGLNWDLLKTWGKGGIPWRSTSSSPPPTAQY
jgi:WD40 repeat protein